MWAQISLFLFYLLMLFSCFNKFLFLLKNMYKTWQKFCSVLVWMVEQKAWFVKWLTRSWNSTYTCNLKITIKLDRWCTCVTFIFLHICKMLNTVFTLNSPVCKQMCILFCEDSILMFQYSFKFYSEKVWKGFWRRFALQQHEM